MKYFNYQEVRSVLLFTTLATIYGVIRYFFLISGMKPEVQQLQFDWVSNPMMMGMLFFLVREVAMLKWRMKQVQIEEKAENFIRKSAGESSITGAICSHWTKKVSNTIDFGENDTHMYVRDKDWALETYGSFWENLLKKQERMKKEHSGSLRCLAFHSTDNDLWLEEKGEKFLSHQKKFIDAGGVVERVLCDDGKNPDRLEMVVTKMKECGIKVYYYNAKKGGEDFTWDFLIVDNQSVIWADIGNIEPRPETAVYTNNGKYEDNDLYERWRKYRDKSELK